MAELSTVARPYAEALFGAARDDRAGFAAWSESLARLAQVAAHPEVGVALSDPRLGNAKRLELFTGLAGAELPQAVRNFVELLVENDRLLLLPEIVRQFEQLKNRHEGISVAEITSAFELSDAQVKELLVGLEKKFGTKLRAQVSVDPSLIGGVRVAVGDQVLDTSVQAQLARMRDTLAA